jgi:hypothetical protein
MPVLISEIRRLHSGEDTDTGVLSCDACGLVANNHYFLGRMVKTPASYSGGPMFKSRARDRQF